MSKNNVINEIKKYRPFEQLMLLASRYQLNEDELSYMKEIVQRSDMNWYEFLGCSMVNRVNGVVYKNIKGLKIPKYVRYFLELAYREQKERTFVHQQEIYKVSELLEKENINYSLLKGAVLNTIFYEAGERISNDTDMMVGVQDIDKVIAILKKEDFIQGEVREGELVPATKKEILFSRLNTYEIVPLIKRLDDSHLPFHEMDINFKLGNDDVKGTAEKMLEDTVLLVNNDHQIRTLALEKFLLFLCIHHYREATMIMKIVNGDDLTLYKFMDIHFVVSQKAQEIDWNYLLEVAKETNRLNDVYYTFYYTELLYPGTFEIEILDMLKPENTDFINQYRGRDNTGEVYEWKLSFPERVFSYKRKEEALKNVEAENKRFKAIQEQLKK